MANLPTHRRVVVNCRRLLGFSEGLHCKTVRFKPRRKPFVFLSPTSIWSLDGTSSAFLLRASLTRNGHQKLWGLCCDVSGDEAKLERGPDCHSERAVSLNYSSEAQFKGSVIEYTYTLYLCFICSAHYFIYRYSAAASPCCSAPIEREHMRKKQLHVSRATKGGLWRCRVCYFEGRVVGRIVPLIVALPTL